MKENSEHIDLLINENMNRQLSTVDWERLYGRIHKRLDHADKGVKAVSIKTKALRWAAGLASAAAILWVIFTLAVDRRPELPLSPGQQAAVELTGHGTVARTEFSAPAAGSYASVVVETPAAQATVRIGGSAVQAAQCEVVLIDQNGLIENEKNSRPSWIIIMASKPSPPENQSDNDASEIAYLL